MTSRCYPSLPLLYFENKGSLQAKREICDSDRGEFVALPAEVLHQCLSFADWGEFAKLACVQTSWSGLLRDAADQSRESKWDLCQALLRGGAGLEPHPERAVQVLTEMSNVSVDGNGAPSAEQDTKETETSFTPAMNLLADCYLNGVGVERSSETGIAWFQAAYSHGDDVEAAFNVASIYEYGKHETEIDIHEAFEWFQKAASNGHVGAMVELGLAHELGCGCEQSDQKAFDWYMKAAEAGDLTAKFSVGESFEEARGVPQSDEEACIWYYRAAVEGDSDSIQALKRLEDIARIVVPGVGRILED